MAKSDLIKQSYEKSLFEFFNDPVKGVVQQYKRVELKIEKGNYTVAYYIKRETQGTIRQSCITRRIMYDDGREVWNHKYYEEDADMDVAIQRLEKLYRK